MALPHCVLWLTSQLLDEGEEGRYHKIISDFGKPQIILYEDCEIPTNTIPTKQCQQQILNGIMMTASNIYIKNKKI